jgi:hypothetical protein
LQRFKYKIFTFALILLSPLVIYLATVNILLIGRILPALVSEGEGKSFNLNYTLAWSLWPGKIHIYGLHLTGTDPNVEWSVRLSRVDLRLRLRELKNRKLSARQLIADSPI